MEKINYKPNKILSKYIDRFYILKKSSTAKFNLPIVLPGTGLELLFHINNTLSVKNIKLDKSHVICPRKVFKFDKTDNVHYISVRFKSGTFRHFTSIPYVELNDSYLSVIDIWKQEGFELQNRINSLQNIPKKIKLIECFLMSCLSKNQTKKNEKWDVVISALYHDYKSVNLYKLSKNTNLSYRQFERNFKNQFGITAKKFQRITRFQDTIKKVLLNHKTYYLDTVLDNGYFDQSHFINEFRSFSGLKPTDYFITESFKNNFYCKSIQ